MVEYNIPDRATDPPEVDLSEFYYDEEQDAWFEYDYDDEDR